MARRRSPWGSRRRGTKAEAEAIAFVVTAFVAIVTAGIFLVALIFKSLGEAGRRAQRESQAARRTDERRKGLAEPDRVANPSVIISSPHEAYSEVLQVNAAALDGEDGLVGEAERVFVAWAGRLPRAPRDSSEQIISIEPRTRLVGRLTTELEGRRFVWRSSPSAGRDAGSEPQVAVDTLDPWRAPTNLRASTLHAIPCSGCSAEGKVSCRTCGGAGRVSCGECDGVGKVHGFDARGARRYLNCKSCRGKGDSTCTTCTRGRVQCETCQGMRRLSVWLEIDESSRSDVQVEPDGEVTRAFRWGLDGVQASDKEVDADARALAVVERKAPIMLGELPDAVPTEWRDAHWEGIKARVRTGERVVSQRFTLLEVPAVDVSYVVGKQQQTITLEGRRLLAPPASADTLFARRAQTLRWAAIGLVALPLIVAVFYLARGSWFMNLQTAAVIAATALLAGLTYVALWRATLPRRGAGWWLLGTLAPLSAALAFGVAAEPDVERARQAVLGGDFASASRELEAVGITEDPGAQAAARELGLAEVLASTEPERAAELAQRLPEQGPERDQARAHVDRLRIEAVTAALGAAHLDEAKRQIGLLSASARAAPEVSALEQRLLDASDKAAMADARAKLAMGDFASAWQALERASPGLRASDAWRLLAVQVALAEGRSALTQGDPARALTFTKRAEEIDAVMSAEGGAAQLRKDALAAMEAAAGEMTAKARQENDVEPRLALERAAENAWVHWDGARGDDGVAPELKALRARIAADSRALEKQQAAAAKAREAEARRAAQHAAQEVKRQEQEEARRVRAYTPTYGGGHGGGKVCNRGCPCGNSCISCSKRCRR